MSPSRRTAALAAAALVAVTLPAAVLQLAGVSSSHRTTRSPAATGAAARFLERTGAPSGATAASSGSATRPGAARTTAAADGGNPVDGVAAPMSDDLPEAGS